MATTAWQGQNFTDWPLTTYKLPAHALAGSATGLQPTFVNTRTDLTPPPGLPHSRSSWQAYGLPPPPAGPSQLDRLERMVRDLGEAMCQPERPREGPQVAPQSTQGGQVGAVATLPPGAMRGPRRGRHVMHPLPAVRFKDGSVGVQSVLEYVPTWTERLPELALPEFWLGVAAILGAVALGVWGVWPW